MSVSRRFSPEKPPNESCIYGCDFSYLIPPGVGIDSAILYIIKNAQPVTGSEVEKIYPPGSPPPYPASGFWTSTNPLLGVGADGGGVNVQCDVEGRTVYCQLGGGDDGVDYQITFVAYDSAGNVWPRTHLQMIAQTS